MRKPSWFSRPGTLPENSLPLGLLVAALTAAVFLPSLGNGFTSWDDPLYITENPLVRRLSLENLRAMFTGLHGGLYKPLTLLSYAVEIRLFGLNPAVTHAVNLALHALNALLVFAFLRLLTGGTKIPFAAALLFAIHPLRVESVAWAAERKDVLVAFFFLAALVSYLYFIRRGAAVFLRLTLLLFALSLLVKPAGITLPFALLAVDAAVGRGKAGTFKEKIPIFILAALFLTATLWGLAVFGSETGRWALSARSFVPDLPLAAKAVLFYVSKLLFPLRLSCLYPAPPPLEGLPVAAGAGFLVLASAGAVFSARVRFGALFFLITLLPALPLFPFLSTVNASTVADRYTYIPSIGFSLIVAAAAGAITVKSRPVFRPLVAAAVVACFVLLGGLTWQRCRVWKDGLALWNDAVAKYPSLQTGYFNRGNEYLRRGDDDAARRDFGRAIELAPNDPQAHNNMGNIRKARGDMGAAARFYRRATELDPRSAVAHHNLGTVLEASGRLADARDAYWRALDINPRLWEALMCLGESALKQNNLKVAEAYFRTAAAADPLRALGHAHLGAVLGMRGRHAEAAAAFKAALALEPESAETLKNLGVAYAQEKDYRKAVETWQKAIAIKPDDKTLQDIRMAERLLRSERGTPDNR